MNSEAPEPPPVQLPVYETGAPPVYAPAQPTAPVQEKKKPKGIWGAILAALAAIGKYLALIWKFLLPILKFAKLGKVLLTAGSMLVSVWVYAQIFGYKFAVGLVVCIFVHEMGHVFMAWRKGLPVSAPIFIPLFGALILLKQSPRSTWVDAVIGIGGPLFGALAGVACWGIFSLTGNYLFAGLAFVTFFINLFNLTPIYPLDGGRIVGAISHWIWIIGLVLLLAMFFTGMAENPLIIVLLILSIPQIWARFRRNGPAPLPATNQQRVAMGAAYIGLAAFLFWGMSATNYDIQQRVKTHPNEMSFRGSGVGANRRI
ncbi:MAG TPA: site-2 protease family protein [Fimbriimonadaceae bacterium]|nr:site-2 protease family protein [Fimbriimonadaceae bacterium]